MTACKAIRMNDEMQCGYCGLTWALDDPEPPTCPRTQTEEKDDE